MTIQTMHILDPDRYDRAAAQFDRRFTLPGGPSSLELLKVILSHFGLLPYENMSKIIKFQQTGGGKESLRLPDEVLEDHLRHHLGGTCFSLTFFLQTILTRRDFVSYPVLADMRWGENVHCALIVLHGKEKYLVDPGYLLNQPLALHPDIPRLYKTEHTGVELVYYPETSQYDLYTFNRSEMAWRYRFRDAPVPPDDFLTRWLSSFHWNGMHGLCLTRVERERMVYIHKTYMRETFFEGKRSRQIKNELHGVIHREFGIAPQKVEEALAAIETNRIHNARNPHRNPIASRGEIRS